MGVQDLSNSAYALSLLGLQDDRVWERIAAEISRRIAMGQGAQFSDQAITNISWAILKVGARAQGRGVGRKNKRKKGRRALRHEGAVEGKRTAA